MDIAEFVIARLGEDEVRATALREAAREAVERLQGPHFLGREIPGWHSWPDVDAMCTRTLRDVAAKRAVMAEHFRTVGPSGWGCRQCSDYADGQMTAAEPWPCATVRAMAAIWSDHPDYRAEWKT
jgi:hypothetical protein